MGRTGGGGQRCGMRLTGSQGALAQAGGVRGVGRAAGGAATATHPPGGCQLPCPAHQPLPLPCAVTLLRPPPPSPHPPDPSPPR